MKTDALAPGQTIGILGGGQLGRMLAMSAARLGLRTHVFEPGAMPPAGEVAGTITTADYCDREALAAFAGSVDVVTYEFENVPADALDLIEARVPIRPNRRALAVSQDRLREKRFLNGIGLATAPFHPVDPASPNAAGILKQAVEVVGLPAILKTRRLGYDGKGQVRIEDTHRTAATLASMAGAEAILEGFVAFAREVSVIAARGADGRIACFEPGENVHVDGILCTTRVPARIDGGTRERAFGIAAAILDALDYCGVIGVELFDTADGLVVNEFAPRVHNSGHWTEAGAVVDQFEQHVRAVAGWPLAAPIRHSDVEMTNLIGEDVADAPAIAREDGVRIHLYGKTETRAGRKMGHATRVLGPATRS
ncbi:MAG: 5-(carboxyamino)imidazole ribonucleotide synthase [Boseongicola sp. SB0677_bin_26]|nr:5-(carboxyamino)imidazole ribonucleotide synthase [Boseongicola sp. SB0665_bin_10]MYG27116.1 5-(carboxyamino)imidazole ribonucleotide synthase [Boseongicola sp. SB0677_bin_26]